MHAIDAARAALVHARNKLAKIGAANVRPAFASDVELVTWQMQQQGGKGAKGAIDNLRRAKDYENIVWDMPSVIAYGKAAAKLGAGNCMEYSAVASEKLSRLRDIPDFYACELGPPSDHVFVVIGETPYAGEFNMNFMQWDVNAAVCDPWADIACRARNYPGLWKQAMRDWNLDGATLPVRLTGMGFGAKAEWVSPTNAAWLDAIDECAKLVKAGPGNGLPEKQGCCCYITTATCGSLGLPDDCDELQTLRFFRDEILLRSPAGRRDVERYYRVAPGVVDSIDRRTDAAAVYRDIHARHIAPAVAAVKAGDRERAHAIFVALIDEFS